MSDFSPPVYNPRWVLWLRSIGSTPATFRRRDPEPYGDITRIGGVPWTVAYIEWVQARWVEWARDLGFASGSIGASLSWERALAAGYTQEDFDRWLCASQGRGRS